MNFNVPPYLEELEAGGVAVPLVVGVEVEVVVVIGAIEVGIVEAGAVVLGSVAVGPTVAGADVDDGDVLQLVMTNMQTRNTANRMDNFFIFNLLGILSP
jgi:hypothetical protein